MPPLGLNDWLVHSGIACSISMLLVPAARAQGTVCRGWTIERDTRLLADLNGDGEADIVAFGEAGTWTALANGDGTFGARRLASEEFGANRVWSASKHVRLGADINKDGKADVVAFGEQGVWTALGNGDGTFGALNFALTEFGTNQGWDLAKHVRVLADINKDGVPDIVAFGNAGVWTSLGNGAGSFGALNFVLAQFGSQEGWDPSKHLRTVADLNHDNCADIVAIGDAGVWTALSNCQGSFMERRFVLADFGTNRGWTPTRHERMLGAVTRDGALDLVAFGNTDVQTARGNAAGAFAPAVSALPDFGCVRFDFNVDFVGGTDPNGLPLNPAWRFARDHPGGQLPPTASCHEFSKYAQVGPIRAWVPDFAECTNQTDASMVDLPQGFSGAICSVGAGDSIDGHVNWFPVTLDGGKIAYQSSNDNNFDNDYTATFSFTSLGVNDNHSIHLEFDAFETVERFTTRGWVDLRNTVKKYFSDFLEYVRLLTDPVWRDSPAARAFQQSLALDLAAVRRLFDGDTIITGMFGLDCEHGCKSELHPLYAMATRRDNFENGPADESWLMFARNVGDEGFCSSKLWAAPFERYTFHLPWREGMTSVEVLQGPQGSQFSGTAGTSGPFVSVVPPNPSVPPPDRKAGVYVQFSLGPVEQKPVIEGTLHLKWTGSGVALARAPQGASPAATFSDVERHVESLEGADAEGRVRTALARLSAAERDAIVSEVAQTLRGPALRPLPAGGPARVVEIAPQLPPVDLRVRGDAGMAVEKEARDRAALRALCTATGGAPAGVPPEVCKNVTTPR
jgi:FG-GAP-like repeat